jgi:type VI protein secretion system component Hcp
MSQPEKPTPEQAKAPRDDQALPEATLEKVTGGKVEIHDLTVTKKIDKASPTLG